MQKHCNWALFPICSKIRPKPSVIVTLHDRAVMAEEAEVVRLVMRVFVTLLLLAHGHLLRQLLLLVLQREHRLVHLQLMPAE
jgi:hypothetical protein